MIVPRRSGVSSERDESWAWNRERWERHLPEVRVYEGHHQPDEGDAFNISAARNRAASAADADGGWDVGLFVDSDSFCGIDQVKRAVNTAARTGLHTIAFSRFCYLTKAGSEKVMAGYSGSWEPFVEWTLNGGCSSVLAVPRSVWDAVGGYDEGFVGWGEEDIAFSIACQTVCPGRYVHRGAPGDVWQLREGFHRLAGDCWHLWHPTSDTNDPDSAGYRANVERRQRYVDAAHDRDAMRSLLVELGQL